MVLPVALVLPLYLAVRGLGSQMGWRSVNSAKLIKQVCDANIGYQMVICKVPNIKVKILNTRRAVALFLSLLGYIPTHTHNHR